MEAESPPDSGTEGAESGGSRAPGFKEPGQAPGSDPARRAGGQNHRSITKHRCRNPDHDSPASALPVSPKTPGVVIPTTEEGTGYHSLQEFTKTQVPEPPTTAPALPGLRLTGSPKAQMPESPTRQQITKTAPSPPARTTRTGNPLPPIDRRKLPATPYSDKRLSG